MRFPVAIPAAAAAIWLASPALNTAYVPWGAGGASRIFVSAVAIWLISSFAMIVMFRRSDGKQVSTFMWVLLAAVGILVLTEVVFWIVIDETNNKPMLSRQSFGILAGFIVAGLAAIATSSAYRANRPEWMIMDWARWIAKIVAGAAGLELALFALRTIFRRSGVYYALDCSMFAVAAVSMAVAIAGLSRCFPLNSSK